MTGEYIDSISPAERGIYRTHFMKEVEKEKTDTNKEALADIGLTEDDFR